MIVILKSLWRWLALWAYRRWVGYQPPRRRPVGLPFNRDPVSHWNVACDKACKEASKQFLRELRKAEDKKGPA